MKKKLLVIMATGLFTVGVVGVASADLITFDFTNLTASGTGFTLTDGSSGLELTVGTIAGNINLYEDRGIGVQGGTSGSRIGDGEGLNFSFSEDVSLVSSDVFKFNTGPTPFTMSGGSSFSVTGSPTDLYENITYSSVSNDTFQLLMGDGGYGIRLQNLTVNQVVVPEVPEPAAVLTYGIGLMGLVGTAIRRKKKSVV